MKTRVQKLGDGLALLLPSSVADQTELVAGAEVDIVCENGAVVARPVATPRYVLDELLARVTDDNIHSETDTGPAVGREA